MKFILILIISLGVLLCHKGFSQDARGAVRANDTNSEIAYNNVYGLIVGVSNYKYVTKLKYAHKDAELIAQVIERAFPYSNHEITVLTERRATEFAILNGLEQINKKAKEGDLVVFYFAGHGDVAFIDEEEGRVKRGYYLTHSANDSRGYEAGGAIRFDDVHDSIVEITNKGAKVYLITDACRAGTIIDVKGASLTLNALNTGFERTTKFLSCEPDELSYEFDDLQHGVYTYYLVKQLDQQSQASKDGIITRRSLQRSLEVIENIVMQREGKQQTPVLHGAKALAPLFYPIENTMDLFEKITKEDNLAMARAVAGNETTNQENIQSRFERALIVGNLRKGSNSAHEVLKRAKTQKSVDKDELKMMNSMLASELMERANDNMNRFLKGRVRMSQTINFEQSEKDLKLAAEILGVTHHMFEKITQRAQFFEAMKLLEKGKAKDFEKIERTLLKLANDEPRATYIHQGLALLYIAKNEKEKAEEQLDISRKRINTWAKPINTAAKLNLMASELDKALENLQLSESLSKDPSEVYLMRGELFYANRQLMDAQKAIEQLSKSSYHSDSEEKALALGKIEELRGRIKEAQDLYLEELQNNETSPALLMKLGDISLKQGDTAKSLGYFNNILSSEPNNVSAKNAIAIIQGNKINQEVNFYAISEVVSLLDELYASKAYEQGLEVIDKALKINNWTPEYHYQKGKFLYEKGDKLGSEKELRKALELSPYSFESIRALSIILIEQKKLKQAENLIRNYEKYFDRSAKWLTFKYKCYYQMDARRDLFSILEKAIEFDSLDLEPRREIVLLLIEENHFESALKEHKELMKVGGTDRDEDRILLYIERQVNKEYQNRNYLPLTHGIEYLIKIYPTNENYTFMGAMIAYMNKDYKTAEKYLIALQRNLQLYSRGFQMEVVRMRGKIYLETKRYKEAESAFLTYNKGMVNKDFIGLAMAQFEMGKKNEWQANCKKQSLFEDYNEDAYHRYQKMMKKMK
jgi:tetratricopeptide (TPR) repeat protein